MATSFREWPWPLQALFFAGLAAVLIAAGLFIPGLPNTSVRTQLEQAQAEEKPLQTEVASLRVYKQRRAELQSEMDALQKQLTTLQTIVPADKRVDEFIVMIQTAATTSGVSIRRLKAEAVAQKQDYFEMPFTVEADGPYFSVLDFFAKLGRLSRIVNVGDMKLTSVAKTNSTTYRMTPGTSVTGTITITTFFSKNGDTTVAGAKTAAAAPAKK
ncbi:MAG: type 4a pilus biogenesis protein PilO [Candidatus Acidiferrales bacterium]|jgi:type IV pilus assembly protein PilO